MIPLFLKKEKLQLRDKRAGFSKNTDKQLRRSHDDKISYRINAIEFAHNDYSHSQNKNFQEFLFKATGHPKMSIFTKQHCEGERSEYPDTCHFDLSVKLGDNTML